VYITVNNVLRYDAPPEKYKYTMQTYNVVRKYVWGYRLSGPMHAVVNVVPQ